MSARGLSEPQDSDFKQQQVDIGQFFKKYPEVKYMNMIGPLDTKFGGQLQQLHPAMIYVRNLEKYKSQGYSHMKAKEMVEQELSQLIEKRKNENRILRGVALDSDAYTYVDRVQEVAELEAILKVKTLERDMPKYLRAQRKYIKQFDDSIKAVNDDAAKAVGMTTQEFLREMGEEEAGDEQYENYSRERVEDLLSSSRWPMEQPAAFQEYQPVLYEVIKDPAELQQRESLFQQHEKFLDRSENIMKIHHQRSHIHDGLRHLSDE